MSAKNCEEIFSLFSKLMSEGNINFSFDTRNVKMIPFDKYDKNFTFIVDGKRYETSRFIADIYSPIICKYHYDDETIDEFTISSTSENEQSDQTFHEFLTLINKGKIELNNQQRSKYGEYFLLLGNIDEYFRLNPLNKDNLTPENVIDRLNFIQKVKPSEFIENENVQQIIKYASEHFFELPAEKVKKLEISLLEEMIKNRNLRIEDEDDLLNFIFELYEVNHSYSYLFEYVYFKNVSPEKFAEFVDRFDIEYLNKGTFRSICRSILNKDEDEKFLQNRYNEKCMKFEYKKGHEFNGIMRYLTNKTNGNIHDNGTINITSNSIEGSDLPKYVVDYTDDNRFRFGSESSPNHELCFDFKDMKIQLTSYSIKSYSWGTNDDHLKSWILEVSENGEKWEKIDEHQNDNRLNAPKAIATFNTKVTKSFYRFVRLTQTGPCFSGHYHSTFLMFEFYGKLIAPNFDQNK